MTKTQGPGMAGVNPAPSTSPRLSSTTTAIGGGAGGWQRAGGIAGLVKAATYVIGFAVMGAYLAPRGFDDAQERPADSLAFLLEHQAAMYTWYLVLYLVGGAALVTLVLAVHHRLRPAAPELSQAASALGLIWAGLLFASGLIALVGQRTAIELAATDTAAAVSTWSSVSVIQDALGGGIEIVGAAWVFLVGIAGIRTGALSRGLGALGLGIGVAGACTLVPQVADAAGSLFGLAFIAWFVWAGVTMLRPTRTSEE